MKVGQLLFGSQQQIVATIAEGAALLVMAYIIIDQ